MNPQRLYRITTTFSAFFLLATLLSSCGFSASPSSAVRSFFSAIDNGENEKALRHFEPAIAEEVGKIRIIIDAYISGSKEAGGIEKMDIISETVRTDSKVKVDYRLHFGNGEAEEGSLLAVQIKGRWYLTVE